MLLGCERTLRARPVLRAAGDLRRTCTCPIVRLAAIPLDERCASRRCGSLGRHHGRLILVRVVAPGPNVASPAGDVTPRSCRGADCNVWAGANDPAPGRLATLPGGFPPARWIPGDRTASNQRVSSGPNTVASSRQPDWNLAV